MEWLAFIVGSYGLLKAEALEKKLKKLEKLLKFEKMKKEKKGEVDMSKILSGLVGKRCKLKIRDVFFEDYDKLICDVLEVDEEWLKFTYINKKKEVKTRVIRIDTIEMVDILEE